MDQREDFHEMVWTLDDALAGMRRAWYVADWREMARQADVASSTLTRIAAGARQVAAREQPQSSEPAQEKD